MESQQLSLNNFEEYRSSRTCFEDLSNEIFYEIFEYLDICDAYQSFYYLNNRFQQLFIQLSLPYKIKFNLISKSTFQNHCQYIITPNIHRIVSLHLSNLFFTNSFVLLYSLDSSFIRLESLSLNKIKSDELPSLLTNLSLIPRLFSFSLTTIGSVRDSNIIHQLIFSLPVLKYCNITFKWFGERFSLSNSICKNNTIEYFITKNNYSINELSKVLSCMSRLVHLSCKGYLSLWNSQNWISRILNNLRYFHFDGSISLDKFEIFLSNFVHQLEILRISSVSTSDYLDSNRWERLICSHLPCLHTFDLQYFGQTSTYNQYHSLIHGFNSLFWIERKWFFTHQHYRYNYTFWISFYSIDLNEYISKNCLLEYQNSINEKCSSEKILLDSTRHIRLVNDRLNIDLHSTHLTLSSLDNSTGYIRVDELDLIIPFEQLTSLTVSCNNSDMKSVMKILDLSPNIQLLIVSKTSLDLLSLETKKKNNIQQIIILSHIGLKEVQELINMYPRLKSLEMNIKETELELIIRFFLNHITKKNHCLSSLGFLDAHPVMIKRLQKMIDRQELMNIYSIECISDIAYLCW